MIERHFILSHTPSKTNRVSLHSRYYYFEGTTLMYEQRWVRDGSLCRTINSSFPFREVITLENRTWDFMESWVVNIIDSQEVNRRLMLEELLK